METYRLQAYNTATQSENKMHDDAVAASFGFAGGLVPGVDVYAYLCHLPAERWGRAWLERGTMAARFHSPVYDGDEVEVTMDGDELSLTARGEVCATGRATLRAEAAKPDAERIPTAPPPDPADRPPATPETVATLDVLGTTEVGFDADRAPEYLDDIRSTSALFRSERAAHPGWLLRQANFVLAQTVRLGPWIHVASECQHLGAVEHKERVATRARVTDRSERKGHHFVVLRVQWVANDDRLVMQGDHTAIYQPRRSS
jgi:acyl dehydratase